jgi:hypothetical protein
MNGTINYITHANNHHYVIKKENNIHIPENKNILICHICVTKLNELCRTCVKKHHAQHNIEFQLTHCHLSVFNYPARPQPPKNINNWSPGFLKEKKALSNQNKNVQGLFAGFLFSETLRQLL